MRQYHTFKWEWNFQSLISQNHEFQKEQVVFLIRYFKNITDEMTLRIFSFCFPIFNLWNSNGSQRAKAEYISSCQRKTLHLSSLLVAQCVESVITLSEVIKTPYLKVMAGLLHDTDRITDHELQAIHTFHDLVVIVVFFLWNHYFGLWLQITVLHSGEST